MPHRSSSAYLVLLVLAISCGAVQSHAIANASRPFWAERSSYVEGDDLYAVGVASHAQTPEEGRQKAFEHGKIELMNFAQVTDMEAQGLVIETQMTYEERKADGSVTVFRLLRVSLPKLLEIQRSRALKLERTQKEVTQPLSQLSGQSAPRPSTQSPLSLTEQLKATEAVLDEREQEKVSRRAQERLDRPRNSMAKKCSLLVKGMTKDEVRLIMGKPYYSHPREETATGPFEVLKSILREKGMMEADSSLKHTTPVKESWSYSEEGRVFVTVYFDTRGEFESMWGFENKQYFQPCMRF